MGAYADLLPDSSDSANTSSSVARSSGNQRVDAFVEQYRPIAERVAEQTGNDPELYLAKWGLETGWGKSIIPGTNNLGNIKDFSGSGVSAKDNATGSVDRYRQYKDANQFADDYASLLNRRYKNALNVGSDMDTFATELKRAGYAEDQNYVSKLKSAYNMLGGSAAQSDASPLSPNAHGEYEPRTDYSAALRQFDKVPNDTYEANRLASTPKGMSISKEISAAIDSYQANLWSIPAAMGSEYALNAMLENKSAAEQQWADSGAPQSFSEMEFGKNFGQYFAHMAIQSAPYMLEFIASGFGVGSLAKGALANTAKGVAEKAAIEAAKQGATKEAAKKAGEVAAKEFMGTVYTASGVAGSYPSAVGDVLSNQYEESGKFNLPAAAALGVPYAALNAAGAEGMLTRGLARGLPKTSLTAKGAAGFAGRAALTGAEAGVMEGSTETGQEVMNQLGRMAVNPDAKIDDKRALEAYKESLIAGALLGGVTGAVAGGFRKPEDAKLQPPAPVANSPLTSAVNTAQHVEKQQQQAAVDDHREQILGMIAQRDDLTERIAGLQNMIDRADPSSEDGQRIRAMQSDMQMRRDSLVAQLDAAKAFYGGDQTANVGPTNDPLILGNEQMSRIYQVTQNLLNDPASLDPESRSGLLKGFSVMRNRTLPEATRIDAAMSLIATMDDMAARRAAAASGRADEREWNAFASDEAARDGEAKLRAIDKSLANSGPKPLPENEVTTMRAQLLDRVLATNPENPNRTFDRALRLEGFRDSAFTDAEKARIAQFAAMRAAPASTNGSTLLPSPSQGRYQHLSEMLDSGWVAADRGRLVGPNGEVYNLKGAGEAQFVRNKLNQKDGNGSQSPRGGAQGGTDQGDFGVGGAGANGPLPQGGGNGSGQANALPDTRPADGAVSEAEATGAGSQPNDPLNQNPTGRLTPLDDQRIAKYAGDLRSMAPDAGYAERGGRNLRDHNDNFTSRTVGVPTAEWFLPGMLNSPQASVDAVERAIRGYPMKKKEKLHVQGMMGFLDMQYGIDGESHTEQLATLSDIAYEGESADAQNIIDTLGDVDLESNGAWADEVESMRALGFTEEEINEITRRKQGAFGSVGEEAAGVPAGEAQTAIPEGDGNGNGQAEGQEWFSLNQQTNTEAAAQFAQQQAGESSDITKEQADKERDAVPFSMQMQSQPKPQGTQVGLFTADGRPSVAAKQPETAKRKIFRDNKETGVREVHEVDAQDVAISELPDHQFFVFKDEEKGAYSLTEASTGLRVGVGETAEAAIADFESKLEKVGVETFAQRVADSQKITGAEVAKPTAPQTVADSAPSPVNTSMRDTGAKAFADGLPRVAPEGIKGADKVRWLTGYDDAQKASALSQQKTDEAPKAAEQPDGGEIVSPTASPSLSDEMAGFTGVSDAEYALRKLSHADRQDGDVELGNGRFVTLEQAVSAAKENMDKADWSKPFQFNRVLDIAPIDWNTMVDAMKKLAASQQKTDSAKKGQEQAAPVSQPENDKPAYADDAELQDALSHLGDVLGDVFGAKLNITGKQYGASDLLPAMSKVIELLIKKGFKSFRESVGAATNAMRGNANTKGFVDQITPRQWKAAYNSVAEFHEGTDSEEDVAKYSAEQIQKIIALPEKIKEAEQATNHDATPGQREAGNYAKGKFAWHGLNIAVETAKGEDRTDTETNGEKWRVTMPATYGYILGTVGADKDGVDVFMGDKPESQRVYVVNQTKPGSTEFDEHKIMLGYESEGAAIGDYLLSFSDAFGASVLGSVSGPYAIDDFKYMLESNRFSRAKPISDRLAYVNPRVEEKQVGQQPPGVKTNGTKEKAAAERLAQLLDKMDQVRIDRNTPEGSAKGIVRSVIEELRKERAVGDLPEMLDMAAKRLFSKYPAFSEVASEVAESLRAADKYAETVANIKAKREERAIPTLDKITVTRSAQLDGKAVEYDQQANEALNEIDGQMTLAKRLLECLAA